MNKLIVGLIVLLFVVVGGFFLFTGTSSDETGNVVGEDFNDVKTFVLEGENFKFMMDGVNNPEIRVNEGDRVRIEFTSVGGFHDWVLDEFDAQTQRVNEGGSTFVEFVADEKGEFEYYCGVGQHRANGMFGKFVVE